MDSISIRPPKRSKVSEREQVLEVTEQEESRKRAEKQRAFALRAGKEVTTGGPADQNNKRLMNLTRSSTAQVEQGADFSFMYGMAVFWDTATFLVGLIPVAGWAINAFVMFPVGLFNMYMMAQSRGKNTAQFWNGYKYIFVEAIPYLNIVPVFVRGVYLIKNEGKTTGIAGTVNSMNKILDKYK